MAVDVVITDGANAVTLMVDRWTYDVQRMPKEFTPKIVPALGSPPKSISTDFGSFAENYTLMGTVNTRAEAKILLDYAEDEWFVNHPITVTIPAIYTDDEAIDFTTVSGTEPIITRVRVISDVETRGVDSIPFEISMIVCKRL